MGFHTVVPLAGAGHSSILFSVGIIGATVMPHVIYLHSSLTQHRIIPRSDQEARRIFRWSIPDVVIAMGLAGLVNMAMLYMAASTFLRPWPEQRGRYQQRLPDAHAPAGRSRQSGLCHLAAGLWALEFHGRHDGRAGDHAGLRGLHAFPSGCGGLVTMMPAVLVAGIGFDPTSTLVISQVVLSFVLPLPVITLVMFTRRRDLMGALVNKAITTWAAIACSAVILSLNVWLLYSTFAPLLGWWQPS